MINPEVLIYINKVKEYLEKNEEANRYLLGTNDYDLFFDEVLKFAEINFEKKGDATLTKEQFEEIRKSSQKITTTKDYSNGVFMEIPNFGLISLN
jgi:hypothetical protein